MADMDKALPNVETELKIPSDEEVAVTEQKTLEEQVGPDDIDITQEDDGSATINFDPAAVNQPGGESHGCLLYTSPSPRDGLLSRMPSSA